MEIDITVEDGVEADAEAMEADARQVLAALDLDEPELSIVLTDDARIQALNATWRDKDTATDVLSFPQQDDEVTGGVLGDLVISVQTAAAQAAEAGHDLRTELRVLLVHGLCHLLGHDHHDPEETEVMRDEERRLLAVLFGASAAAGLVERAGIVG